VRSTLGLLTPVKIENGASCERSVIKPSSGLPPGLWTLSACLAIARGCVPVFVLDSNRSIHQFVHTACICPAGCDGRIGGQRF
jgi:hypothetical protein